MEIVETEMNKSFDWSIYTNSSESDTSQIENEIEAEWKEVNGEGIEEEKEALLAHSGSVDIESKSNFFETEMNKSFDWSIYTNASDYDTSQIENEIEAEWREVNEEGTDEENEALLALEVFSDPD
jgi:hypothetical protein